MLTVGTQLTIGCHVEDHVRIVVRGDVGGDGCRLALCLQIGGLDADGVIAVGNVCQHIAAVGGCGNQFTVQIDLKLFVGDGRSLGTHTNKHVVDHQHE